jgi:hypothetical protein
VLDALVEYAPGLPRRRQLLRRAVGGADGEDMLIAEHPSGRYNVGDRTPGLGFAEDGEYSYPPIERIDVGE